ncbi:UNVERIFIED_ORG: peptidoglycan/LPS O-acetylase OafA/YrhL [Citrobacter freundii]
MKQELRFEALHGMRGICALLIACSHFSAPYLGDQWGLFRNAFLFTDLFFGLSGFILLSVYQGRLTTLRQYRSFVGKRLRRILPVHLLTAVLIVMMPAVAWGLQYLTTFLILDAEPGAMPPLFWDRYAFLVHLFLLQGAGLLPGLVYNFPAWSLGAILYCSLLMGGILFFTRWLRVTLFITLGVVSVWVMLTRAPHYLGSTWDYGMFRAVAGFFTGALVAEVRSHFRTLSPAGKYWLPLWQTLALMLLVAVIVSVQVDTWQTLLLLPALALFLWLFSYDESDYARALQLPVFRWLSDRAYSVFMTHALLLFLGAEVHRCGILSGLSPFTLQVSGTLTLALYLLLLLIISDWTWRHVECRFNGKPALVAEIKEKG